MNSNRDKKVIVITGATQGLGYALARWFCQHFGNGATVYLTGRSLASAKVAAGRLAQEDLHTIAAELDVSQPKSITAFVDKLRRKNIGVDILISNAAARITPDKTNAEQVEPFVITNNLGTTAVLSAFTPLINTGAHVLVVASAFGSLRNLPVSLHHYFDVEQVNLDDLDNIMRQYVQLVQEGKDRALGWPEWINLPSKIAQVAAVKVYNREHAADFVKRGVRVNAVCPGLMDTGASRPWFSDMSSAQTPDQAAEDVAWLATLPYHDPTPMAGLIQHRRVIPWK